MIDANSQFFAILTNVGMAKQANADALGIPWKITDMGLGDASLTDPIPVATQTKLINEWRRRPLNQLKVDAVDPAIIIAEQIIPADEGGRWIREIGLYDADGDLVAVANCAPSYKPLLSQGSGRTQVVRMNFIVNNSGNITLKIDPAVVLASRAYVDAAILEVLPKNKTPGEYTRVKVNDRGVVVSGDNPTTLAGFGITDAFTRPEVVFTLQSQGATAFTTAGASPAYTLTPTPALGAYAPNQRYRVKFHEAGSGTLNISGQGPKNLKQYDANGVKVATVIGPNQLTDVEFDGTDMVVLDPLPASPALPYNYFSGFSIANNALAPTTTIDVAPGAARDSTDAVNIKLTATIRGILQAAGVWTAGDNQNKLDTGSRASNTSYHKFAIRKTSDGTGDILFSLSPTAPTMPNGYAGFVLIESIRTDGSGNILPFINVGRSMTWKTVRQDVVLSNVAQGNSTVTLSTPPGRRVKAILHASISAEAPVVYTHSPDVNNEVLGYVGGGWKAGIATNDPGQTSETIAGSLSCITGTASDVVLQTFTASGNVSVVQLATLGWEKI